MVLLKMTGRPKNGKESKFQYLWLLCFKTPILLASKKPVMSLTLGYRHSMRTTMPCCHILYGLTIPRWLRPAIKYHTYISVKWCFQLECDWLTYQWKIQPFRDLRLPLRPYPGNIHGQLVSSPHSHYQGTTGIEEGAHLPYILPSYLKLYIFSARRSVWDEDAHFVL